MTSLCPKKLAQDPDRVWIATRVVRRVAEGSALKRGLEKQASSCDVLKLLRTSLISSTCTLNDGESIIEGALVIQALCTSVINWARGLFCACSPLYFAFFPM